MLGNVLSNALPRLLRTDFFSLNEHRRRYELAKPIFLDFDPRRILFSGHVFLPVWIPLSICISHQDVQQVSQVIRFAWSLLPPLLPLDSSDTIRNMSALLLIKVHAEWTSMALLL